MDRSLSVILSSFVAWSGVGVMLGWSLDLDFLKSLDDDWVTMKFTTALCFAILGFAAWLVALGTQRRQGVAMVVGLVCVAAVMVGVNMSTDTPIGHSMDNDTFTPVAGRMSAGTAVGFVAAGASAVAAAVERWRLSMAFATVPMVLGGVATLGYLLANPALYYYTPGASTAMALHTAVLFMALGSALWLRGRA